MNSNSSTIHSQFIGDQYCDLFRVFLSPTKNCSFYYRTGLTSTALNDVLTPCFTATSTVKPKSANQNCIPTVKYF